MLIYGKLVGSTDLVTIETDDTTIASICNSEASSPDLGNAEIWIAPPFMDLQINGVGGINYKSDTLTVEKVVETMSWIYKTGTGFWCPTITTSSTEEATHSLRILAKVRCESALAQQSLVGFHVEGPYIASEDGPRGAHPLEHTRDPDWDEFCRYQEAADGHIRILTLAPERKGALKFIERVVASGVIVSIGHSGASQARIREAIAAGATMSTHLGNGAHAMLPRHDNYLWAQLAADELWAGIIPDGHHLPQPVLKSIYRIKQKQRLCLVSDAAAISGLPPGIYDRTYGTEAVEIHPNGKISLAGTPYLAGAALFLNQGIATMVTYTDATLDVAIKLATRNPARLLKMDNRLGTIDVGRLANFTLFYWQPKAKSLSIVATIIQGEIVYQSE